MPHAIEIASSGRAKCRGCGQPIHKDELRFGERQANAFGDGEMTLWFHLRCGAYLRPEPFLEALASAPSTPAADELAAAAQFGIDHRRVPRIHGAERAATGRARCRHCKELIDKGEWRIALVFFEEYRFNPGGFIHAGCASAYFETIEIAARLRHFSADLIDADVPALDAALRTPRTPAA